MLVAVSWGDFLLVEAMYRSLAESKDEEEMCVPLLHTVQARQSTVRSTASFCPSFHILQRCRNGSPRAASHACTFGNPGSARCWQLITWSLQTVSLCAAQMAVEKHKQKHV